LVALILELLLDAERPLPSLAVTGVFIFAATVVAFTEVVTPDQVVGKTTRLLAVVSIDT
jgi:hypothetical protein